jgi:DNA-binding XRE family transcriptional regulator
MRERQCHICKNLYTAKLNHVKKYHTKDAYIQFEKAHLNPELSMCHKCKRLFDGDSLTHIALKHRGPALKELAKTLE